MKTRGQFCPRLLSVSTKSEGSLRAVSEVASQQTLRCHICARTPVGQLDCELLEIRASRGGPAAAREEGAGRGQSELPGGGDVTADRWVERGQVIRAHQGPSAVDWGQRGSEAICQVMEFSILGCGARRQIHSSVMDSSSGHAHTHTCTRHACTQTPKHSHTHAPVHHKRT